MSSSVPVIWKCTFWSHNRCFSDFIIVTEVVIPSLTDDESPEWCYTIRRIATFKKFVRLRFSKALQFYLCLPLSISDDSAFSGLAGWVSETGFMDSHSIQWSDFLQPCFFVSCSGFHVMHNTTETVEPQRLKGCMQLFVYYLHGRVCNWLGPCSQIKELSWRLKGRQDSQLWS